MKPAKRRLDRFKKPLRILLIVFGAIAAAGGFYGFFHGGVSYAQYNARVGTVETGNALWLGIIGVIMMVMGLIPPRK
jgi:hypothetical protein